MTWIVGTSISSNAQSLIAIAIALGLAWPVFRGNKSGSTIKLLREELGVERDARKAQEERYREELAKEREARHEQDKRHAAKVGELEGKIQVITHDFASVIADSVIAQLDATLEAASTKVADKVVRILQDQARRMEL